MATVSEIVPKSGVSQGLYSKTVYRLKEVKQGELELEVNWFSVLDQQNSP